MIKFRVVGYERTCCVYILGWVFKTGVFFGIIFFVLWFVIVGIVFLDYKVVVVILRVIME